MLATRMCAIRWKRCLATSSPVSVEEESEALSRACARRSDLLLLACLGQNVVQEAFGAVARPEVGNRRKGPSPRTSTVRRRPVHTSSSAFLRPGCASGFGSGP